MMHLHIVVVFHRVVLPSSKEQFPHKQKSKEKEQAFQHIPPNFNWAQWVCIELLLLLLPLLKWRFVELLLFLLLLLLVTAWTRVVVLAKEIVEVKPSILIFFVLFFEGFLLFFEELVEEILLRAVVLIVLVAIPVPIVVIA